MTITLTANYKEVLKLETVEFIEENCIEGEYDLDDALKFIDEHNEDDFVAFYDEYIRVGEILGYDVVDAFIEHQGDLSYVNYVEEAYRGEYNSGADFTEEFYNDVYGEVPPLLVVDWEATWKQSLSYEFDFVDGYVFSSSF
jgi:antirestriction protein